MEVPPVRAKMSTWTVGQFVVAQDERRRCRPDLCEVSGTRGVRWTDLLPGREERGGESAAAAASHESPYSCHPEFLDGRMTSLSSYGFVFGSTDSIGTSVKGSSLGTFFLDLSCPCLPLGWYISVMFTIVNSYSNNLKSVPIVLELILFCDI